MKKQSTNDICPDCQEGHLVLYEKWLPYQTEDEYICDICHSTFINKIK